jgi:hypothetical protein
MCFYPRPHYNHGIRISRTKKENKIKKIQERRCSKMYKKTKFKVGMPNPKVVVPKPNIEVKENVPVKTMAMLTKSKKSPTSIFHPHK